MSRQSSAIEEAALRPWGRTRPAIEALTAGEPERRRRVGRLADGLDLDDETCHQVTEAGGIVGGEPMEL